MAYATSSDVIELHGQARLELMADRDDDGDIDTAAVDRALEHASSEIDSRLSVRYATPISGPVPSMVKIAAIEIASYRLANNGNALTEDIRKRYEDMIAWLKDVASGKANLGVPEIDDGAEEGDLDFRAPVARFGTVTRI